MQTLIEKGCKRMLSRIVPLVNQEGSKITDNKWIQRGSKYGPAITYSSLAFLFIIGFCTTLRVFTIFALFIAFVNILFPSILLLILTRIAKNKGRDPAIFRAGMSLWTLKVLFGLSLFLLMKLFIFEVLANSGPKESVPERKYESVVPKPKVNQEEPKTPREKLLAQWEFE